MVVNLVSICKPPVDMQCIQVRNRYILLKNLRKQLPLDLNESCFIVVFSPNAGSENVQPCQEKFLGKELDHTSQSSENKAFKTILKMQWNLELFYPELHTD